MPEYSAPLQDILFTIEEIGGLGELRALPAFEDAAPDLVAAVLEEAARFAGGVLSPLNAVGDRHGVRWSDGGEVATAPGFREAFDQFRANGWHAMPARPELGGQGLPVLVSTAVAEMWKSANLAFSLCQMLTLGAVEAIAHHGSAALKATYLPPLAEGRWTGTMNLTEPQAGSDLAALRARAVPAHDGKHGDHYRITGTKIFITWGEHDLAENIVHLVLARLPGAPEGVRGISLFLVPKFLPNADGSLGARNDLVCASVEHKLGIHASPTAVMGFGDREGAIGWLVGEPHQGLACMFTMMNHARLNVGLEGVAISERAYQQARAYARERVQGRTLTGSPAIIGHPDVRRMLLDMKARTEAQRALAYFAAGETDRAAAHTDAAQRARSQALVDLLIPIVKGWCTEGAQGVAGTAVQVHGGVGFIEETGAAQFVRDARITTIYEGTTGIQANDLVGRKVQRDGGAAVRALQERIAADAARLRAAGGELAPLGAALEGALAALADATGWLLGHGAAHPAEAAAGAVPFLHLTGTVAGGWLLARGAEAAARRIAEGEADRGFLSARIATARHFAAHELVHAGALRDVVLHGAATTLALADADF
ncbi:acyl-CoA dehydrogenase [Xylophilus sp.]|uniref:acyl-CoA dehydrogenase n=1 Tax=Xylophilus sp. TaxID=2653893 RepID=UPI0013BAE15F|nr:acyl-CoA dehydrogenase [Xylophilus sp.]KAF1043893.1 MAG: 3-methylmercaptopropionyl-CoA dehydrogenase [Xylophilus sp.]